MDSDTSRFLSAFNSIEQHLREMLDAAQHRTFLDLVHQASDSHSLVRRLSVDLRHLADLRNFLVHSFRESQPLALPTASSLQKVERIRDALLRPVTLHSLFSKVVQCCRPTDLIGAVAAKMHKYNITQLPVYDQGQFTNMLTAETLARWLAARLSAGVGLVEEESVGQVLEFRDQTEQQEFADHLATVSDAILWLERHYHRGRPLRGIILTPHGSPTELPTGIVTAGDFPKLLEAAGL